MNKMSAKFSWPLLLLLIGCAAQRESTPSVQESAQEKSPEAQTAIAVLPVDQKLMARDVGPATAPSGYVLVREYVDSIKTPAGDEYQRVHFGWDYAAGIATEKRFRMDGTLISDAPQPALTMITTPEELAYAFWLVKQHPDLKAAMNRKDAIVSGGFSYREPSDPACNERSRCVHVMVSGGIDGEVPLEHAIVDLMSRRVVHPQYKFLPAANR